MPTLPPVVFQGSDSWYKPRCFLLILSACEENIDVIEVTKPESFPIDPVDDVILCITEPASPQ